ncbi:MAG: hypothetical protein HY718_08660 [Planctomycetes bacterium]|nr:hypothetical protein [Planctomycetota bacterium]
MTRLMTGVMVVLAAAAAAMAGPGLAINGGAEIQILPGQTLMVPVTAVGAGSVFGLELYLQADSPFRIENLVVDAAGSGTVWEGHSSGAFIVSHGTDPVNVPPELAIGFVSTPSDPILIADGALVSVIELSVPFGTPENTTGIITTNGPVLATPSNWAGDPADVQGETQLRVIPEPASVLLLLGALPLIRRRRA